MCHPLHTTTLGAISRQQQLRLLSASPEAVQQGMGLAQVALPQPLRLTVQTQLVELTGFCSGG
jgi:hypothetical protein